ncbi:MAG TPA: MFS transporter [Thermoleophilaceae bacterium]|nr:MFS transporter [Thermoleophilaceae bacterium]
MSTSGLTRRFVLLRALRWLPVGLVLPFLVITPEARGLSLGAIGAVFAVHSAVAIVLEVPSGALADLVGRRRVLLVGAALTAFSLLIFAVADSVVAFMASTGLLAAGRALISGSLEAWYVDSLRLLDPAAPLSHGLSRGASAEAAALAVGSLAAGGLVSLAGPGDGGGAFSGYGIAALAGALAAVGYLIAVALLVDEGDRRARAPAKPVPVRKQVADIFATARDELMSSVAVRVVFVTGLALGMSFTAVELLWQPHLADLLTDPDTHGVAFGGLAAGSMFAAAAGAAVSPRLKRGVGLRAGYLLALAVGAVCVALLGAPDSVALFIPVYLVAYLTLGLADPLHFELLNDAVGPTARATLISGEALATQGGALVANLAVGALASDHGAAFVWALAGTFLTLTTVAVAVPLYRTARTARA